MKSWLVKIAIVLTVISGAWSQDEMSITTPDGKTVVIQRGDPRNQVETMLTKFLRGGQNGKFIMRYGPGMSMELDKQGTQVSCMTPRGRETGSAEKFLQGFLKARSEGQAKACESNLKNIATALEMYAMDHKNKYPDSLKQLPPGNYLRMIPSCPASHRDTYSASYRKSGEVFEVHCSGSHPGREAGHPFYNSNEGLTH